MARYNRPGNNFPDYGYNFSISKESIPEKTLTEYISSPPAVQTAVALAPGRNKIMTGEKKVVNNPRLVQRSTTDVPKVQYTRVI